MDGSKFWAAEGSADREMWGSRAEFELHFVGTISSFIDGLHRLHNLPVIHDSTKSSLISRWDFAIIFKAYSD